MCVAIHTENSIPLYTLDPPFGTKELYDLL